MEENIINDQNLIFETDWYIFNENDVDNPETNLETDIKKDQNEAEEEVNLDSIEITQNSEILQNNLQELQVGNYEGSRELLPYNGNLEEIYKFEDNITVYEPVFDTNLDEFFFLLTSVSVGTFFITICGLSLMFINQSSLIKQLNHEENITCIEPHQYPNQTNQWCDICQPLDEEEIINKYCTGKYRKTMFKNRYRKHKSTDRQTKRMTRDCKCAKTKKTKTEDKEIARRIMEDDDAQDEQFRMLQRQIEEQKNAYNTLKNNYEKQTNELTTLKDKYSDHNLNKRCIKLMLKEIMDINNELKDAKYIEQQIQEVENQKKTLSTDSDKTVDKEKAKTYLREHIKKLKVENEEISNLIKEKQRKLFHLSKYISRQKSYLNYKKEIVNLFEERLKILEDKPSNTTSVDIPLKFLDTDTQKCMSHEMLEDIINNKTNNTNICLCEELEDPVNITQTDINSLELNSITKKSSKMANESKPYIAKWDDKTIWYSRKLNDEEHKMVQNFYPKCNPKKGWNKNRKYSH